MIDFAIWAAFLAMGYCVGKLRDADKDAMIRRERAEAYTEGVTDTINSIKRLTVGTIIANLKRR